MNNNVLKSAITAVIKQNGNEEITGDILQQTLIAMVDALGGNYQFAGIATSATNPGTPDQHVFYLAAESDSAVYANFGGITVEKEICALCFVTSWTKMSLVSFDEEPTEDSGNLVSSGAIFQALENLASYVEDAFMPKVPTAVENNIAIFDGAGNVKDSGKSFAAFLPADGIAMASGLIDVISAGTDQEFLYRKSGGDGVAFYKGIKGKSIVWNQQVQMPEQGDAHGWILLQNPAYNADGSFTITPIANWGGGTYDAYVPIVGHKYYVRSGIQCTGIMRIFMGETYITSDSTYPTKTYVSAVFEATSVTGLSLWGTQGVPATFWDIEVIDLTLMFGDGNEPSTVAEFEALYPGYHGYNPSIIKNNDADSIESVGFNLWDEEWENGLLDTDGSIVSGVRIIPRNFIPIVGGESYHITIPNTTSYYCLYDSNYQCVVERVNGADFTAPSNARYMKFMTGSEYAGEYNHDICINISDPDRNGEYEPYWKKDIQIGLNALRVIKDGVEKVINGLDGVGSAFDLAKAGMDGYVRGLDNVMDEVDLGDLEWTNSGSTFWSTGLNTLMKFPTTGSGAANGLCDKYGLMLSYSVGDVRDKVIYTTWQGAGGGLQLRVKDSAYSDADTFKAAMQGVKLRFELATPIHYELVEPFFAGIMVDEDGTENAVAPSAATTPSAPFVAQTTYTISIPNLVKKLSTI